MSLRKKTLLMSTTTLLVATSIIPPLSMTMTSCANPEKVIEDQFDKEYGVTETTYKNTKEQFVSKYKAKLTREGVSENEQKPFLDDLDKKLSLFDKAQRSGKYGFTSLTNSLMDFAKNQKDSRGIRYSINLDRKTRANWSQLDSIFNSWNSSFRQYMINSDMSPITVERVLKDARNNFNSLKQELKSKYQNDALNGIIYGKEKMVTCFESVNDEIALVSSCLRLKDFMSQYVFDIKTDVNDRRHNESCLDWQEDNNPNFAIGNILSDETMNQMFKITRKDDGEEVSFSSDMVKGYTLQPKLTGIQQDPMSNTYAIEIDFGLVKTSYIRKYTGEKLASVTGHIYSNDDMDFNEVSNSQTLADALRKSRILSREFPVYLTLKGEINALTNSYFSQENKVNNVHFEWTKDPEKQGYESFFDNAVKVDRKWNAILQTTSLANTGLMIFSAQKPQTKFISDIVMTMAKRAENPKPLTKHDLSEQFINNCEITSQAVIDDSSKTVTHTFYASYKNSIYGKDPKDPIAQKYAVPNTFFENECIGHATSKQFYARINQKFNKVIDFVSAYNSDVLHINNLNKTSSSNDGESGEQIGKLDTESIFHMVVATAAVAATAITIGVLIFKIWSPFTKKTNIWVSIVTVLLTIAAAVAQGITYSIFVKEYFIPVRDFVDGQKNAKEKSNKECVELFVELNKDLNTNFVLINDDGTFDEEEYKEKKANFDNNLLIEEKLAKYQEYSNLEKVKNMDSFLAILKEEKVTPEEFHAKFDGFNTGGKWWYIMLSVEVVTAVLTILIGLWVKKINKQSDIENVETYNSSEASKDSTDHYLADFKEEIKKSMKDLAKTDWREIILDPIAHSTFYELHGFDGLVEMVFKEAYDNSYNAVYGGVDEEPPSVDELRQEMFGNRENDVFGKLYEYAREVMA